MNKVNAMNKLGVVVVSAALAVAGCVTASLATAEDSGEMWEKFKSIHPVPYEPMGFKAIDAIGARLSLLTDQYVENVVKPTIEADKEGYTGAVAQFAEDVAAAKKDGKTADEVLQAWDDRYGKEVVQKLPEAFKTVRQLQDGKTGLAALALKMLPDFVELSKQMPGAIDEIKAATTNPMEAAKLTGSASQVGERIDMLVWSANFMRILSKEQAEETAELQKYVDSFMSKVN